MFQVYLNATGPCEPVTDRFKETDFLQVKGDLELWFQTGLGRSLLASQRASIETAIAGCYGFHQAEIGVSHRVPVGNHSQLGHRFYVLSGWEPDLPENSVISRSEEIALEHDIADLVILHHALDFSSAPHQTLREASRILKPSGHLVIVGFNPVSSWGLRRLLTPGSRAYGPWGCRFISGSRVEDWLSLLDFKVGALNYHFYALPFNQQRFINRFSSMDNILNAKVPLGAYYLIMAQKQVGQRVKPASVWRKKAKVVGLPVANRVNRSDLDH
ncbi:MAG: SAM-dependent methyltransferase [Oleiphilus sp.]|nr:MAG: SAM-dependent methyltransferase [Oleiphilus sp.]